jgi:hypothetical protein
VFQWCEVRVHRGKLLQALGQAAPAGRHNPRDEEQARGVEGILYVSFQEERYDLPSEFRWGEPDREPSSDIEKVWGHIPWLEIPSGVSWGELDLRVVSVPANNLRVDVEVYQGGVVGEGCKNSTEESLSWDLVMPGIYPYASTQAIRSFLDHQEPRHMDH